MAEICKNCANEITLNFCANCGQKKTKRIDARYLKDEFQYTVLHTNKGFFYTCKQLFRRPGHATREFVEGNRVNHYKPLALVFLLAGLTAFISHGLFDARSLYAGAGMSKEQVEASVKGFEFIQKYQALLMVALIPYFSFFTWLFFRKWGYNYFEHIVINAFFTATQMLFSLLIVYPVLYLSRDTPYMQTLLFTLPYLVILGLLLWFFPQFYHTKGWGATTLRVFGFLISIVLVSVALSVLLGIFFVVLMKLFQHT